MTEAAKYWEFVKPDGTRKGIRSAEIFFGANLSEFITDPPVTPEDHRQIQKKLFLLKDEVMAQVCLRCCISHLIKLSCEALAEKFGQQHRFTKEDLFPIVLDDDPEQLRPLPNYKPLAVKILQTFDPTKTTKKTSLSTWTSRLVNNHQGLNKFFLEQGLYRVSDWAILNDTELGQLQRILGEVYQLSQEKIQQLSLLLESYHRIYRSYCRALRQQGSRDKLPSPSRQQLQQIANLLASQNQLSLSGERVLFQLEKLAQLLRQYRINVRGGLFGRVKSVEETNSLDHLSLKDLNDSEDEGEEFLERYRQEFLNSLDEVIANTTQARFNYLLSKRDTEKATRFLRALKLSQCERKTMTEIALDLGMRGQDEVTNLLKLKQLRSDIKCQMLNDLKTHISNIGQLYTNPEQLIRQSEQIDLFLDEQLTDLIEQARKETSTDRNLASTRSLLTEHLCKYLEQQQ